MTKKDSVIWAEMARRKNQFHPNTEWSKITLWGLFNWGMVSHLIKSGELITDGRKEHRTIWVKPSPEAYHQFIEPLLTLPLDSLTRKAGWE